MFTNQFHVTVIKSLYSKQKDTVLLKLSDDSLKMKGIQSITNARDQFMVENRVFKTIRVFLFLVKGLKWKMLQSLNFGLIPMNLNKGHIFCTIYEIHESRF